MNPDFIICGLLLLGFGTYTVRTRTLPVGPARDDAGDTWTPIRGRFAVAVGVCWIVEGGALVLIGLTR